MGTWHGIFAPFGEWAAEAEAEAGITEHLDGLQRRHPVFGFPVAVIYKYVDDQGSYLSALITYYAFVSLFPLLLLLSTVLG